MQLQSNRSKSPAGQRSVVYIMVLAQLAKLPSTVVQGKQGKLVFCVQQQLMFAVRPVHFPCLCARRKFTVPAVRGNRAYLANWSKCIVSTVHQAMDHFLRPQMNKLTRAQLPQGVLMTPLTVTGVRTCSATSTLPMGLPRQ